MTPPDLVAQTEGVEGAHSEVLPVRTEGEAGDGIVVEAGAVELAAEHVPDSVATLLPARHYPASAGAPVSAEDEALPVPASIPDLDQILDLNQNIYRNLYNRSFRKFRPFRSCFFHL